MTSTSNAKMLFGCCDEASWRRVGVLESAVFNCKDFLKWLLLRDNIRLVDRVAVEPPNSAVPSRMLKDLGSEFGAGQALGSSYLNVGGAGQNRIRD
jgi:hypothetical protein